MRIPGVDTYWQDLRHAARSLRRTPGFTAVIVLTLALGIGANTAIFSVTDALLLRWLPVPDAQRIVHVSSQSFPYPLIGPLAEQKDIFSGAFGFSAAAFSVGPPGAVERTSGAWVSGGYYDTLGLRPISGRLLTPEDDRRGAAPAAVITDGYWQRKFGRDPRAIGQPMLIEGVPVTIVGVSPPEFTGVTVGLIADVTLPVAILPQLLPDQANLLEFGNFWLQILARPNQNLTAAQAEARLAVVWPQLVDALPTTRTGIRRMLLATNLEISSGGSGWSFVGQRFRQSLFVLMGAVGLVLLIACANVANLLLARATAREREIAVRLALGAGRWQLVRQLLTESLLLSLVGGAIGFGLATASSRLLVELLSTVSADAIALDLTPNWHVLGFTSLVAIGTGVLFGLVPALRATALPLAPALKLSPGRIGSSRSRIGPALVVFQVSLSLLLLTAAGLFVRTLDNLRHLDPGFRHEGVFLVNVDGRQNGYRGLQLTAFYQELLANLQQVAGVTSVSLSRNTPLNGSRWWESVVVDGQPPRTNQEADFNGVAPRYFETMGTPILSGRDFTPRDSAGAPAVAIVDEAFVRRYFSDGRALGRRVSTGGATPLNTEVVGVVKNTSSRGLREAPQPTVYVPYFQQEPGAVTLEARAAGSLKEVATGIQNVLRPRLPQTPIQVQTLTAQVEAALVQERLLATLASGFGVLALLLAAVGLYGLLAYTVTRRVSEIGIRTALGAQRFAVMGLVVRQSLMLTAAGIALGLAGAAAVTRYLKGMLFGLSPLDPTTFVAVSLMFGLIAAIASYVPTRRALRVDPTTALRAE